MDWGIVCMDNKDAVCELSMPPIHLHNRARKEPFLPLFV